MPVKSPDTCVVPGIHPQLGSAMQKGFIFCSVQIALVSLSSGMCHPVPLGFFKLPLACTMVCLLPPPAPLASTCGVRWGVLVVKYVVYSSSVAWKLPSFLVFGAFELLQHGACPCAYCLQLSIFCSVEVALAPASWSILPSRHSVYYIAWKVSSCLVCQGFVICGVQDSLLSGFSTSYLFWRGTYPQASFGEQFFLLQSASCHPSWLFEV